MPKMIFILQRKAGPSREECLARWAGWVQNHVVSAPGDQAACDGVGELSFESDDSLQAALGSPEMAAAVEDAQNFLDMERTDLVIVEEKTVVGARD